MEGFKLWLHPFNWKQSPLPLRIKELQHATAHDERISLLREVCCIASTYSIDVAKLAEVVIHQESLVVSNKEAASSVRLPLSLAQIDQFDILESPVQRSDAALGFVAYGYPMQANQALWRETNYEIPSSAPGDVWLFVVTADTQSSAHVHDSCSALSQAMNALVLHGAISGDINIFEYANQRVAKGGFGSVQFLRYKHGNDNRIFAGKFVEGEDANALCCAECQYLHAAGNHPNIVAFRGLFCFVTPSQECMWMILMDSHLGGDLFQRVRCHGTFSERASLEVSLGVLNALRHLHKCNIIHRDVKPGNVVQASDSRAVLIDMGIAVHSSEQARRKKMCGSPGFTAPEILLRRGCEFKSDVFGCGALLYFVASGRGPFMGSNKDETMALNKRACINFDDRHFLALRWQSIEVIRHMLEKKPRRRPDARAAHEAVTFVLDTLPQGTLPGATANASGDAMSELAEPLHQEATSTSWIRWPRPISAFSSIKSSEAISSYASSSSKSSSSSVLGAARQKLSAGPVVRKVTNSAQKLKSLMNRVNGTRTEVEPFSNVAMPRCSSDDNPPT
eukprot:TRINITY_DN7568_c0_g2_i2.p1 TRINITY_DN7568_c0_g2~~TRINITY_DN7568_c0_g2_i2.p1  ORF type:complete len:564 (+),score=79.80 TRINITY_DN7568_c0_g2_i2:154-1845(+)